MGGLGEGKVHRRRHIRGAVKAPGAARTSPGAGGAQGLPYSALREHGKRMPHREGSRGMGWMEFQGSEVLQMVAQAHPHHPCQGPVPSAPSLELLLLWRCEKGKVLRLGGDRCRGGLSKGTWISRVAACNAQAAAKEDVVLLYSSCWHHHPWDVEGSWSSREWRLTAYTGISTAQQHSQLRRGQLHS